MRYQPVAVELWASRARFVQSFDEMVIGCAGELREEFDARFAAPRSSHVDRFVWDPWHVTHRSEDYEGRPIGEDGDENAATVTTDTLTEAVSAARGATRIPKKKKSKVLQATTQYSMLRTPASSFFPEPLFEKLCTQVSEFGQAQFGCDAFTPPWLACYTDGHSMNWHTDAPHGPFAFVLSLTPTGLHSREDSDRPGFFQGGETMLMKPHVLDYWRRFDASKGLEVDSLIDSYDPQPFGRLLVFDGRFPHKVETVKGTRDPRRGRLVLTGWFSDPRNRATGGLAADRDDDLIPAAEEVLQKTLDQAYKAFEDCDLGNVVGFLSCKLSVREDGTVSKVEALCDTLVSDPAEGDVEDIDGDIFENFEDAPPHQAVKALLHTALIDAKFPTADQPTEITIPLSFGS